MTHFCCRFSLQSTCIKMVMQRLPICNCNINRQMQMLVKCCTLSYNNSVLYQTYSTGSKSDPIPFLKSKARKFKVDDAYSVEPNVVRKQRYAIPLGLTLFTILIYLGFVRNYDKSDRSVVAHLTQDIRSKLPESAREKLSNEGIIEAATNSSEGNETSDSDR